MNTKRFCQQLPWMAIAGLLLAGRHSDPPATKRRPTIARTIERRSVSDSARLQTIKDSLAVLATASDTFRASNQRVFKMHIISKAQYDAVGNSGQKRSFPADSAVAVATEKAFLKAEVGRVWRSADTLFFHTNNGRIVWLHDGPTYQDAEDSYEGYRYLDNLEPIKQWLVEVGQWEGRHYLLMDQQTGKD